MRKAFIVLGVIALILVLTLAGGYWWLTRPVPLQALGVPVAFETRDRNTDIATAMASIGVTNVTVDAAADPVAIAYEMPAGTNLTTEDIQAYALGVLAFDTSAHTGIVGQYANGSLVVKWTGDLDKARATPDDAASQAAYFDSVEKTAA